MQRNWLALAALMTTVSTVALAQATEGDLSIGQSTQAVGQVTLTRDDGASGTGSVGDVIFLGDLATTGDASRYQVTFVDDTALTIGQNAEVVFDEFVFQPADDIADLGLEVVRGSLRFVSGTLEDITAPDVTIQLSSGVIGIRGTIAEVVVGADEIALLPGFEETPLPEDPALVVLAGPGGNVNSFDGRGVVTIQGGGSETTLRRQNTGVILSADGISDPFEIDIALNNGLSDLVRVPRPSRADESEDGGSGTDAARVPFAGPSTSSIDARITLAAVQTSVQQSSDLDLTIAELISDDREALDVAVFDIPDELSTLTVRQLIGATGIGVYQGSDLSLSDGTRYNIQIDIDFSDRDVSFGYQFIGDVVSFPNRSPTFRTLSEIDSLFDNNAADSDEAIAIYEFNQSNNDPLNNDLERLTITVQGENGVAGSSIETLLELIEPGAGADGGDQRIFGTENLERQ